MQLSDVFKFLYKYDLKDRISILKARIVTLDIMLAKQHYYEHRLRLIYDKLETQRILLYYLAYVKQYRSNI